jgi:hypothetical protein
MCLDFRFLAELKERKSKCGLSDGAMKRMACSLTEAANAVIEWNAARPAKGLA